jgi:hypothetical protein
MQLQARPSDDTLNVPVGCLDLVPRLRAASFPGGLHEVDWLCVGGGGDGLAAIAVVTAGNWGHWTCCRYRRWEATDVEMATGVHSVGMSVQTMVTLASIAD